MNEKPSEKENDGSKIKKGTPKMKTNARQPIWLGRWAVLALTCFALPATASGQSGKEPQQCLASDKVEIINFSVTPTRPQSGQSVRIIMKIKNKCHSLTHNLSVPWTIMRDSTQISSGTVTLAPESTSGDLVGDWIASGGTFNIWGAADPENTLKETERSNNKTNDYRITVAGGQIELVREVLNHVKAKNAGANFTANPPEFTRCELSTNGGRAYRASEEQVKSWVNCIGRSSSGKGDFEGYLRFTLKNGWKVKSYEVLRSPDPRLAEGSGKGWSLVSAPQTGTNNPYYKLHLWADGGQGIEKLMKITIEGPLGTNPYQ